MKLRFVISTLFVLLFSGCESVLNLNIFQAIDSPAKLDLSKLSTSNLEELENRADSASFFNQLRTQPEARKVVTDKLQAVMTSASSTDAEKTRSAALFIEVQSQGTSAHSAVNNIFSTLFPLISSDAGIAILSGNPEGMKNTLVGLMGSNESEVAETLEALSSISDALNLLSSLNAIDAKLGGDVIQASILGAVSYAVVSSATGATLAEKAKGVASIATAADPSLLFDQVFANGALDAKLVDIGSAISTPATYTGDFGYVKDLLTLVPTKTGATL